MVERARILEAVKAAIEKAPERKFSESVDITINLKNIDMAQPKNRIDETILLPHGTGKTVGIAVLGKGDITTQAREAGVDLIIGPEEIERLGANHVKQGRLQESTASSLQIPGLCHRSADSLDPVSGQEAGCRPQSLAEPTLGRWWNVFGNL